MQPCNSTGSVYTACDQYCIYKMPDYSYQTAPDDLIENHVGSVRIFPSKTGPADYYLSSCPDLPSFYQFNGIALYVKDAADWTVPANRGLRSTLPNPSGGVVGEYSHPWVSEVACDTSLGADPEDYEHKYQPTRVCVQTKDPLPFTATTTSVNGTVTK
jgi:hypothetical protein